VSDEGDAANDAASDGGETEDIGGRTAVVTKASTRPQRPTGKRSRVKATDTDVDDAKESSDSDETEVAKEDKTKKSGKAKTAEKSTKAGAKAGAKAGTKAGAKAGSKAKKPKKAGASSANPVIFVYNYIKQVVAEMRKVIWPNRKQMLTYTSVVLVFLAFMVALVGLADFGLAKLVLLVFG
jgi:preprotein translocase subunit SecE